MKHSIKREQSHARMGFAEFENQRSLAEGESNVRATLKHMKLSFHLILTLVAMLTMAQTAWAECDYYVYYTYGSKNYYLEQGDQVVNVSTVLQQLQLYGVCTDVQTFDNSCVAVTAIDNDWTLQVKKAFETKVINCTVDGQAYEIKVTSLPNTISVVLEGTLFFDKQGGTGEYKITSGKHEYTDRQPIRENSTFTLPECPYTAPEGCSFAGWEIKAVIYQANDLYFFTGTTTAKALWKNNSNDEIINRAPEHNISIASGLEHGSIGVQVTAREGEIVPVTMLPADGYLAQSVSINGSPITLSSSTTTAIRPDGNYTFTMPSGDVTISADFVKSLAGGTESVPVSLNDPDVYFLTGGWYVVDHDITFTHYIILAGDVHLVLADGFTMNLGTKSQMLTSEKKPILGRLSKDFDYGLTIHGGTEGTGALNAYYNYSDINGSCINVKDFTFEGGKMHIETKGIDYAVVVGNDVTINGGDITLISDNYRGGITSRSGDVRVTGGTINGCITTTGDIYMSAGTIRGIYTDNENAYITGGKITEGANARRKLSLSFTGENDLFYVDKRWTYPNIFIIEPGVVMTDGTTNYSGILSNDDVAALTGKTLHYQPGTYYTVHYNTNANTNDGDVIRYEVPDQSILGTGKLSRGTYLSQKGHKFSGWNTAADGSGTPYADMATVTLTGDLELYAQWDKYDNTVTKGTCTNGDITIDKTSANTNETVTLTVNPASGYLLKRITITDTDNSTTLSTIGEDNWYSEENTVTFKMPSKNVTVTPEFTNDLTATNGLALQIDPLRVKAYTIPEIVKSFNITGSANNNSSTTVVLKAHEGYRLQATGNVDFIGSNDDDSEITIYDGANTSATLLTNIKGKNQDEVSIGTQTSSSNYMTIYLYEDENNAVFTGTISIAPIQYSIGYDLAGGSVATENPTTYTIESDAITLNNPTREGYTFAGWTGTDLGAATTSVTIAHGSTGNREYTATWNIFTYNITYNGVEGATNPNPANYTIESETITLNNPGKDGYTFAGWFDNAEFTGDAITTIAAGSTGDKTLWAKWQKLLNANDITITGLTYNGQEQTPTIEVKDGETILMNESGYTVTFKQNDTEVTAPKNAGEYTAVIAGKGNYSGTIEKTFDIALKPITVSGITAVGKPYDGTADATLDYNAATISGLVSGDNLTVTATGTFADANAGEGKEVAISGITLVGTDAANYVLADQGQQTSATASIAKATPEAVDFVFSAPTELSYDGSAKEATFTLVNPKTGVGSITNSYYKDGVKVDAPVAAGTYTVKIDVAEGDNFVAATALKNNSWTFTITGPAEGAPITIALTEEYGTYCSDYDLDFSGATGLTAYIAAGYNKTEGSLLMVKVTSVPKGTGLLLKSTSATGGNFTATVQPSPYVYSNLLTGTIAETDVTINDLILGKSEIDNAIGFYRVRESGKLAAGKAYLKDMAPTAGARMLSLEFYDDATGIADVRSKMSDAVTEDWYSLDGRKWQGRPTKKGLYLLNGKKVVVR